MKGLKLIIFSAIFLTTEIVSAQNMIPYFHLTADAGWVLNSSQNNKPGLGGTFSLFIADNFLNHNDRNYFTLGIRGLNNPYDNGQYFKSMNNSADDAFNYYMILAGYRLSRRITEGGWYFEPRAGYARYNFKSYNNTFVFSPVYGYDYKNFDFSAFFDFAFAQKNTATGYKGFFTPGISIGYNFGLMRRKFCNCHNKPN